MAVEQIRDVGQALEVPEGKVVGVVGSRADFDEVVRALREAGFGEIESLHGQDGIQLLERAQGFYFSDSEDRLLERHLQELEEGHYLFAVSTPSERAEEASEVAARHGAYSLVHFGTWTITWLKQ